MSSCQTWSLVEGGTLGPEGLVSTLFSVFCRYPGRFPEGESGQSDWRGGWPLNRQQPRCPADTLPSGHAVPDPHPQLQHALVRSPRENLVI